MTAVELDKDIFEFNKVSLKLEFRDMNERIDSVSRIMQRFVEENNALQKRLKVVEDKLDVANDALIEANDKLNKLMIT